MMIGIDNSFLLSSNLFIEEYLRKCDDTQMREIAVFALELSTLVFVANFSRLVILKDINDDIFGAQNVNIKGILVRTGKYIDNIEAKYPNQPTRIVDTFADAVDWLMSQHFSI